MKAMRSGASGFPDASWVDGRVTLVGHPNGTRIGRLCARTDFRPDRWKRRDQCRQSSTRPVIGAIVRIAPLSGVQARSCDVAARRSGPSLSEFRKRKGVAQPPPVALSAPTDWGALGDRFRRAESQPERRDRRLVAVRGRRRDGRRGPRAAVARTVSRIHTKRIGGFSGVVRGRACCHQSSAHTSLDKSAAPVPRRRTLGFDGRSGKGVVGTGSVE